jgi:GTP cyclohydrolase-4
MTSHTDPSHTVFLGLGSNLGDRQANLAQAIGRLRREMEVEAVSPAYETEPVGVAGQPRFVNLVLRARTDLELRAVLEVAKRIERDLGRVTDPAARRGPRPIDIDLLFYDDAVVGSGEGGVDVPHPRAHERAFVLVPLADIAPELVHPVLGETVSRLRAAVDDRGVRRLTGGLLAGFTRDVQAERPRYAIGLERVGVTGLERVIHLSSGRPVELFYAEMDLFVDLRAEQKGAHMSRFPDLLDQTLDELVRREAPDIESLAARVAEGILDWQGAERSEVRVRAKVPRTRYTPLSAQRTQDVFTLLGRAVANGRRTVRLVGVEVAGLTACPCAQEMVRDHARQRLLESGFSGEQAELVLSVVPLATHNQRGRGMLVVSDHPTVSADDLVRIVEASMSSEIYELLKRPDEFFVVNRAHQNPRFVEDVVRHMLGHVVQSYEALPDDAFVLARQVNSESIHRHDVLAERGATMGDLRRELGGGTPGRSVRVEQWLEAALEERGREPGDSEAG